MCQAPLSFTICQSLLKFMPMEAVILSNHLILFHPLLLMPTIFPSTVSFSVSQLLAWGGQKYCSFSIHPSNEYSGLIFFRIDWFDSLLSKGLYSSSAPQFENNISSALSFLYGPTLTSVLNYWKYHSFDHTFSAKWCPCFWIWYLGLSQLSFQGARVF